MAVSRPEGTREEAVMEGEGGHEEVESDGEDYEPVLIFLERQYLAVPFHLTLDFLQVFVTSTVALRQ